jgi:hypothetical protein
MGKLFSVFNIVTHLSGVYCNSLLNIYCNEILIKKQKNSDYICKGKGKGRSAGPIQHGSLKADCTLPPEIVPFFISRGAPHQVAREASTSDQRRKEAEHTNFASTP